MKTLIQILIFPALLAVLLFSLFAQTSNLLEETPQEERILGVTHERNETQALQNVIFFSPKITRSQQ